MRDAIAPGARGSLDVIVAPGTQNSYEAEPADPGLGHSRSPKRPRVRDRSQAREVDDRDALSYLYTSGTTSFPKGVVGSHLAIYLESMSGALDSGWNMRRPVRRDDADVPHRATQRVPAPPAILVGATIYVLRGFDPAVLLDLIEREQVTQVFQEACP